MDQNNKILIGAALIILVAIVSFRYTDITGEVTKDAVISVSPSKVYFEMRGDNVYDAAKLVTINVKPGTYGVDRDLELYREDGSRVGGRGTNRDNYDRKGSNLEYDSNMFEVVHVEEE
jgi:hypothetical protein